MDQWWTDQWVIYNLLIKFINFGYIGVITNPLILTIWLDPLPTGHPRWSLSFPFQNHLGDPRHIEHHHHLFLSLTATQANEAGWYPDDGRNPANQQLIWRNYPPVNKHSNGKSPSWIGNTSSNGGFSIAMLDYRRNYRYSQGFYTSQVVGNGISEPSTVSWTSNRPNTPPMPPFHPKEIAGLY